MFLDCSTRHQRRLPVRFATSNEANAVDCTKGARLGRERHKLPGSGMPAARDRRHELIGTRKVVLETLQGEAQKRQRAT
jgi:hypothetical protein